MPNYLVAGVRENGRHTSRVVTAENPEAAKRLVDFAVKHVEIDASDKSLSQNRGIRHKVFRVIGGIVAIFVIYSICRETFWTCNNYPRVIREAIGIDSPDMRPVNRVDAYVIISSRQEGYEVSDEGIVTLYSDTPFGRVPIKSVSMRTLERTPTGNFICGAVASLSVAADTMRTGPISAVLAELSDDPAFRASDCVYEANSSQSDTHIFISLIAFRAGQGFFWVALIGIPALIVYRIKTRPKVVSFKDD